VCLFCAFRYIHSFPSVVKCKKLDRKCAKSKKGKLNKNTALWQLLMMVFPVFPDAFIAATGFQKLSCVWIV